MNNQNMNDLNTHRNLLEHYAEPVASTISSVVEIVAASIIGIAVITALVGYFKILIKAKPPIGQRDIRIQFGGSVAVALELLLGADVIATAVAPTWDDIGKLAAIATIRTALNFFLERDLRSAG